MFTNSVRYCMLLTKQARFAAESAFTSLGPGTVAPGPAILPGALSATALRVLMIVR